MPNHFHAIVFIKEIGQTNSLTNISKSTFLRSSRSLGSLVAGFKSSVTTKVNLFRGTPAFPVWQRNYYDHIIRDEADLNRIREYIVNNPLKWELDREFTEK
jgi:REP element-mobilizing transposase RayT